MTKGGHSLRPERLGDRGVAEVVKRRTLDAGLDPSLFSGHSLRAGFVTAATRAGVPGVSIAGRPGTGPPPRWPRASARTGRSGEPGRARGSLALRRVRPRAAGGAQAANPPSRCTTSVRPEASTARSA